MKFVYTTNVCHSAENYSTATFFCSFNLSLILSPRSIHFAYTNQIGTRCFNLFLIHLFPLKTVWNWFFISHFSMRPKYRNLSFTLQQIKHKQEMFYSAISKSVENRHFCGENLQSVELCVFFSPFVWFLNEKWTENWDFIISKNIQWIRN